MERKRVYAKNKQWWEKMVQEGCGYTQPWLDLNPEIVRKYADGQLEYTPKHLEGFFPLVVLSSVKDRDVLCLASGGGQQSAVFGLLGARVTVIDIAKGQLERDKQVAEYYGYEVETIQSDLSDLSFVPGDYFDLVYQADSVGYIPNVHSLYKEMGRVVRGDGLFRVDAQNPVSQFVDEDSWDGKGYRISVPYSVTEEKRSAEEDVVEFRHYLSTTFNGLIEGGFCIEQVEEHPFNLYGEEEAEPGVWPHVLLYAPHFVILARKR